MTALAVTFCVHSVAAVLCRRSPGWDRARVTKLHVSRDTCTISSAHGFPFFSQWRFQLAGLQIGREELVPGAAINSWYDPVAPGLNSHPKACCSVNLGAESNRPDLMLFTSLQLQPSSTTTAADGTIGQGRLDCPAEAASPNGPCLTTQSRLFHHRRRTGRNWRRQRRMRWQKGQDGRRQPEGWLAGKWQ